MIQRILRIIWKAFKNIRYHSFGKCNVCGKYTIFVCGVSLDTETARNSMRCPSCGSFSRKRHVAKVVLETFFNKDVNISSIRDISKTGLTIDVYNTVSNDSFYKFLGSSKSYICSEYFPDVKPGEKDPNGVLCQDLQRLTFDDDSYDLVISEDVFEHVRDYKQAFQEVRRVLRDGGYHIFTIPCPDLLRSHWVQKTVQRVDVSGDKDIFLLAPKYHKDKLRKEGIPVYTDFGLELLGFLESIGFSTEIHLSRYVDGKRNGIFDSFVFKSRLSK